MKCHTQLLRYVRISGCKHTIHITHTQFITFIIHTTVHVLRGIIIYALNEIICAPNISCAVCLLSLLSLLSLCPRTCRGVRATMCVCGYVCVCVIQRDDKTTHSHKAHTKLKIYSPLIPLVASIMITLMIFQLKVIRRRMDTEKTNTSRQQQTQNTQRAENIGLFLCACCVSTSLGVYISGFSIIKNTDMWTATARLPVYVCVCARDRECGPLGQRVALCCTRDVPTVHHVRVCALFCFILTVMNVP